MLGSGFGSADVVCGCLEASLSSAISTSPLTDSVAFSLVLPLAFRRNSHLRLCSFQILISGLSSPGPSFHPFISSSPTLTLAPPFPFLKTNHFLLNSFPLLLLADFSAVVCFTTRVNTLCCRLSHAFTWSQREFVLSTSGFTPLPTKKKSKCSV